jgi:hypothetical protein
MRRMSIEPSRTRILAAVVLGLAATQCDVIIGIDKFRDCTTDCGGAGGTSSSMHASSTGSATTNSSMGTGGTMACKPGAQTACYDGPTGTEGTSVCVGGMKTCAIDGSGYGACVGEVLPTKEDCYKKGDEDCDGNACSDPAWELGFTDTNGESVLGMATDSKGDVYLAGGFNFILTVDGQSFTAMNPASATSDYYLAKFDHNTRHLLWLKQLGDGNDNGGIIRVAVDTLDNVIIAGQLSSSIDFGGGTKAAAGPADVFVAKYDKLGNYQWAKTFGDAAYQTATALTVDTTNNIVIAGNFSGTADFTTSTIVNATTSPHGFIAKFDPSGTNIWSKAFVDGMGFMPGFSSALGVAVDPSNPNIIFATGIFGKSISLGGSTFSSNGMDDIFLAKFDGTGAHLWSQQFGSTKEDTPTSIGVAKSGNVAISGAYAGTIAFGGTNLTVPAPLASPDGFVAVFDTTGAPVWSKGFGGSAGAPNNSITFDSAENIFVAGGALGDVDFGAGSLTHAGGYDVFLVKFDNSGSVAWNKIFGDAKNQLAKTVAFDVASGNVIIAGLVDGSVSFGLPPLTGNYNAFLATFQP